MNPMTKLFVAEIGKQATAIDMYYIAKECQEWVTNGKKWSNIYNYHNIGVMRVLIEKAKTSIYDNFELLHITHNLDVKSAMKQIDVIYNTFVKYITMLFFTGKFEMSINYIGYIKEEEDDLIDYDPKMFE